MGGDDFPSPPTFASQATFSPSSSSIFPGVPTSNPSSGGLSPPPLRDFGMDVEIPSDASFPEIPEMPSFVHTNPASRPSAPLNFSQGSDDPFRQPQSSHPQQPQQQYQQQQQQQLLQEQQRLQEQIRLLEQQRLQEQQRLHEQQRLQQLELQRQQQQQQQLLQQMQSQQQKANPARTASPSSSSNGVPSSSVLNSQARHILQQQEWRPAYQPGDYIPDEDAIIDATQHAKYVLSALQFDDVPTAIKYLCYCLKKLTGDDNLFSQPQ